MTQSLTQSPTYVARKRNSRADFESPSKQLFKDLERALEQIQIHESEEHKVRAYERRSWYGQLDQWDQERATQDFAALDAAKARHEAIRSEAEKELQKYYKQVEEEERKKREEEERKLREKQAREKAERERLEREEAAKRAAAQKAKEEAERKAAEAKAKAEAEERQRKEREETAAREKAEQERKEKEAVEKKAAEEKAKKEAEERAKEAEKATITQAVSTSAPAAAPSADPSLETRHQRYLEIHQSLKTFRHTFWDECKKNKEIKGKVGEIRRTIKTAVGQLVEITPENKGANNKPTITIRTSLQEAAKLNVPPIDLNTFMLSPLQSLDGPPRAPSALIYALNIFAKAIISQFSNESGVNPKAAEPAGILVANVFANPDFQYNGNTLIDILLAKFHVVCPVLFGISGLENSNAGKKRLGWRQENGTFVSENRHAERMTGLGAGFAAVALRNFSKSKNTNPYPPVHYWEAFASIVNTTPSLVQPTHLLVLKGMIENSCDRFLMFFHAGAISALRRALKAFPASLPDGVRKSPACNALALLPETLERDKMMRLFG